MKKDKKKRFKGLVNRNAAKQSRSTQHPHLNLPKGISIFREEPGSRVSLDIMPYRVTTPYHPDRDEEYELAIPGELWYKRPYWLHRNIGMNNELVVCPASNKQKCPICEYRAKLLKDGTDWNDDSVKSLKQTMRNLYVVIPKGHKNYDEKPYIWDISQFLFQDKLNEESQENEEYESYPDWEEGFTLRIRFSEQSFGANKFAETSRIDFVERKKPYEESILDQIPALDEILIVPSYKAVEALFFGGLSQDELDEDKDDDDDNDKTTDKKLTPRKNEPDEDEDEEEVEGSQDKDEDEEEEKPKQQRTQRQDKNKPKEKNKGKCPHGHVFGKDCDEHKDCDECKEWEDCSVA